MTTPHDKDMIGCRCSFKVRCGTEYHGRITGLDDSPKTGPLFRIRCDDGDVVCVPRTETLIHC